jgi:hypothetical protein
MEPLKTINDFSTVRVLSLANIGGTLSFEGCDALMNNLMGLELTNVWLARGALAWLANSQTIVTLAVRPQERCIIGSLAPVVRVHNRPTLQNLELVVDSFDNDLELVASLSNLRKSFPTLSSVTLRGRYEGSLLQALLSDQPLFDSQIETLALTVNPNEDLQLLSRFKRLHTLTLYSDTILELPVKLASYSVINSRGDKTIVA